MSVQTKTMMMALIVSVTLQKFKGPPSQLTTRMANVLLQTTPSSSDYIDWPPVDVVLDKFEAMANQLDRSSTAAPQEPRPNGIGHNNPPASETAEPQAPDYTFQ